MIALITRLPYNGRQATHLYDLFGSCGLDLDPMTLIYDLDLNILKGTVRTTNEVSKSRLSKVRARTGQTRTSALSSAFAGGKCS